MGSKFQEHDQLGRFTQLGDEPLSKKVRGVRLPIPVDEALEKMDSSQRAKWLRKVITDAAIRDGLCSDD